MVTYIVTVMCPNCLWMASCKYIEEKPNEIHLCHKCKRRFKIKRNIEITFEAKYIPNR